MSHMPPAPQPYGHLKPHRGTTILVLGILGFFVCFICGIVAWVMGNDDLRQMDAGQMDPSGRDLTQAGRIIGIIVVLLNVLALVIALLFFVFAAVLGVASSR
ncbi:MAG: hypothetical protein HBSAPP03_29490 [Phycisphaerae bacterium]|nr:MAG: hypothetical protein HBSAPP03_29490 [Phycisphaerae bacterium]